jgi:hypothetical protein
LILPHARFSHTCSTPRKPVPKAEPRLSVQTGMANTGGTDKVVKLLTVLMFFALGAVACAAEPRSVVQIGSRNLKCPRSEVQTTLNRSTPVVREYLVGCDFMFTRVHCSDKGCHPAAVKPPCIGDMPCFEEDPITLEWRLPPGTPTRKIARTRP